MADYEDLTTRFPYKGLVLWADLDQLAQNDAWLKTHGWETATKKVFFQAAAPTGWTKDTTAALDGRLARVVSGGTGGTNGGGSDLVATAITLAHAGHTISSDGSHSHAVQAHAHAFNQSGAVLNAFSLAKAITVDIGGSRFLRRSNGSGGGVSLNIVEDDFATLDGSFASTSDGAHTHGGSVANSQLSNITLAYIDVILCSKDASSGYVALTNTLRPTDEIDVDTLFDQYGDNDAFNYGRLTPAGTVALFAQTAAPTGWTKLATQDNKGIRIVIGSGGGTGGSAGLGNAITLAHSHTITSDAGHTHTSTHNHVISTHSVGNRNAEDSYVVSAGGVMKVFDGTAVSQTAYKNKTNGTTGTTTGVNAAHDHSGTGSSLSNVTLAYLDIIQCSKDSTGAPTSYNDMSAAFVYKRLISKQRLAKLAGNDAYCKFHTMPLDSVSFFYQATAPLSWVKKTTQNDKALRIVSGSSGGTAGGTQPLSTPITLAHTHTISSVAHTHGHTHNHTWETATQANGGVDRAEWLEAAGDGNTWSFSTVVPATDQVMDGTMADQTYTTDSKSHNHGGVTGSQLTDLALAYSDFIMCQKL